jgi:hypothetical protein
MVTINENDVFAKPFWIKALRHEYMHWQGDFQGVAAPLWNVSLRNTVRPGHRQHPAPG